MIVEEREREIDVLHFQNKKLARECNQLEQRNKELEKIAAIGYRPKPPCREASTNTPAINFMSDFDAYDGLNHSDDMCGEDSLSSSQTDTEMVRYKDRVIKQKTVELDDVYAEYQLLLGENESLRKEHKLPARDRKKLRRSAFLSAGVGALRPPSRDASTNTVRTCMPGMAVHKKCTEREFEKLRNFLLAEVMSLQLLYSMFDLKTKSQLERENALDPDHLVSSSMSTTPSGYETGSDDVGSQSNHHHDNNTNNTFNGNDKNTKTRGSGRRKTANDSCSSNSGRVSNRFTRKNKHRSASTASSTNAKSRDENNPKHSMQQQQQQQHIESAVPKTGTSIEEIIEAQRSGSYLLSDPSGIKDLPIETRVQLLKKEICQQKKTMDQELSKMAHQQFGIVEPGKLHFSILFLFVVFYDVLLTARWLSVRIMRYTSISIDRCNSISQLQVSG